MRLSPVMTKPPWIAIFASCALFIVKIAEECLLPALFSGLVNHIGFWANISPGLNISTSILSKAMPSSVSKSRVLTLYAMTRDYLASFCIDTASTSGSHIFRSAISSLAVQSGIVIRMTFSRDLESPTVATIGFKIPAANNTLFILVRMSIRSNDAIFVLDITTTRRSI